MKNGDPLKRYNIILRKQDGYAGARIEEGENGAWVKYSEVMEQRNKMYALELTIELLEDELKFLKNSS